VRQRDDLSVELCALYNQVGQHDRALALLGSRHFQPWEGGEGGALGQYVRAHLALGREALRSLKVPSPRPSPPMGERVPEGQGRAGKAALSLDHRDAYPADHAFRAASEARAHFEAALRAPRNLGEAKHLLANQSDIHYWLGCACDALGDRKAGCRHWRMAATFQGDFQEMSVRTFSEMTYYSALSWGRLGQLARMKQLLRDLLACAKTLQKSAAQIDYFATSLPAMLLFEDDIQFRQETHARFLQAQAHWGLGRRATARALLASVLQRDPNHMAAADFAAPASPARGSAGTPRPTCSRVNPRTRNLTRPRKSP
jgi:tetratricopeptide (TPR) repeat protein